MVFQSLSKLGFDKLWKAKLAQVQSAGTRQSILDDIPEVRAEDTDKQRNLIASDYEELHDDLAGYRASKLVRLDIRLNGDVVDALSVIVHKERAYGRGKVLCERLRKAINRQQYDVAIQAAIGNKIISRETVKALRKDVTAKCYGGDISRKRKLLEKQKAGKKRMKQVGNVEIPQEAFLAVLKAD